MSDVDRRSELARTGGGDVDRRSELARTGGRNTFSAEARARLAALADALIPAGDGMPSASEAGVAGEWLDAVLAAEPGFGPPLAAVLAGADVADPASELRRIESTDPDGWGTLTTVVAGAYFLNPEIAERVGYPGRRAIPVDADPSHDWLEDGLLDSVRSRGTIYRPTPGGPSRRSGA